MGGGGGVGGNKPMESVGDGGNTIFFFCVSPRFADQTIV